MRWSALMTFACLPGCAGYRYAVVVPARVAGPVDRRSFDLVPLRYAAAVSDDRLAVRVDNPTADTVRLSGAESSVVDPAGRSHPLVDQTIAAGAYAVVVLPPLRPWFGPTVDVGPTVSMRPDDDPGYDRASPVYWNWPGVGDVRVHLVYRRADGTRFEHDLAFRRDRT